MKKLRVPIKRSIRIRSRQTLCKRPIKLLIVFAVSFLSMSVELIAGDSKAPTKTQIIFMAFTVESQTSTLHILEMYHPERLNLILPFKNNRDRVKKHGNTITGFGVYRWHIYPDDQRLEENNGYTDQELEKLAEVISQWIDPSVLYCRHPWNEKVMPCL